MSNMRKGIRVIHSHGYVKEQSLQQMVLGKLDIHIEKNKVELLPTLHHIQNINSEWNKELNVKSRTNKKT